MFPDDPAAQSALDTSVWWKVVKPFTFESDNSTVTTVITRMKSFHDVAKRILEDAQLTVVCRRYLNGDPLPWEGANLRHGALIFEIVDKSAWRTGTSFGGNLLTGLERMFTTIGSDGLTEGVDYVQNPNFPSEYYDPSYSGTRPEAPWIIFEQGRFTGIESSEFVYYPATDVRMVVGGHSAPYVNEGISAGIQAAGDMVAAMIGVPPLGGVAEALLRPLFTDVFFAFMTTEIPGRAQELGDHYWELMCEGADRAYTLAALIALRVGMWDTRERFSDTLKVADACPYRVGEVGYGDFFLGDRVGVNVPGMPPEIVMVERVMKLGYEWDVNGPSGWQIGIGRPEPKDPILRLFQEVRELASGLSALGLL